MPRIMYVPRNFKPESLAIIEKADAIARKYERLGYNLTLRQLYYQFIAEDFFPNTEQSYNRLGSIINDARLAGLIDWNHLEDRGRSAYGANWLGHVPPGEAELIRQAQRGHSLDLWKGQEFRVEIWVEKQALEEVAERAAGGFRVGYFACKGYVSQSEMWTAGRRLGRAFNAGQKPLVLHLGDHDPSGIDMTRDIEDRLSMFAEAPVEVRRLALNMDQIDDLQPPPNPAKVTDSRFERYRERFGDESWELDAIAPDDLVTIIRNEIMQVVELDEFNERIDLERRGRQVFEDLAENWDEVRPRLEEWGYVNEVEED